MNNAKNKIIALLGASALIALVAVPALSATDASVTATVTPGVISVSVSPPSVGYGTVNIPSVELVPTGDTIIGANNNGGVPEDLTIKGANATGTTKTWTIVDGSPGGAETYNYNHKFIDCGSDSTCTSPPPPAANNMTTTAEALATGVLVSSTEYFKLRLSTPTATGGDLSVHSTTVTVMATAT